MPVATLPSQDKVSVLTQVLWPLFMAGTLLIATPGAAQDITPPGPGGSHLVEMHQMMMAVPTTLSISATGEVSATPDMARINFGVLTEANSASEAMKLNNLHMNSVFAALKSAGISSKDIQTSSLNLMAKYDYTDNQHPKLSGYQATNQVSVRINDLASTGVVIDSVIKAGVNQVDSVNFGLKNDSDLLDQARLAAVKILTQRADLYAKSTGLKVKRIIALTEGDGNFAPPPRPVMMMAKMASDSSTPVAGGDLQMSVTISGTFELEK